MLVSRAPKYSIVHAEGDTLIIWVPLWERKWGLVQNKPLVPEGDGKYRYIPGKDAYATAAACNIFHLLNKCGISTHYQKKIDEHTYLVRLLKMIPIEIIVRFIAYGSLLERNPSMVEGTELVRPVVELCYKSAGIHDPIMIWNNAYKYFQLHNPHKPLNDSHESPDGPGTYIGEVNPANDPRLPQNEKDIQNIEDLATQAALVLSEAFRKIGGTLVDLKIECGYGWEGHTEERKLYIGDQIGLGSCRIRIHDEKSGVVNERKHPLIPEKHMMIVDDYKRFAEMTAAFANF